MDISPARISVPAEAKKGDIIAIKTLFRHPMETGYRVDRYGKLIARRIVKRFSVSYAGDVVFAMDFTQGVAANPFIAFHTVAVETGEIVFVWEDDQGKIVTERRTLTVAG